MVCIHFARKIIGGSLPGSAGASPASFVGGSPNWVRRRLARILRWRGSTGASPASFVGLALPGSAGASPASFIGGSLPGSTGASPALHAFAAVAAIWCGRGARAPRGGYADGGVQARRLRTQLWIVRLQRRIFRRRDTCVPYLRCCRSDLGGRGARAPRGGYADGGVQAERLRRKL